MSFFKPTLPHIYMTANIQKVRRVPLQSSNDGVNSFPGSLATHSSLTSDNTYYHNLPMCPVLVPVESWDSSLCVNKFLACLHTGLCPTHHARTRKATKKKIPHTYNSSENWIFSATLPYYGKTMHIHTYCPFLSRKIVESPPQNLFLLWVFTQCQCVTRTWVVN